MPKVQVVTDGGEVVGEVATFELSKGTRRSRYGFDGIALTEHMDEARRRENVEAMVAETEEKQAPKRQVEGPRADVLRALLRGGRSRGLLAHTATRTFNVLERDGLMEWRGSEGAQLTAAGRRMAESLKPEPQTTLGRIWLGR